MKNSYVSQIDDTLKEYVEALIKEFPEEFASDGANNRLVKRYFKDVYNLEVHNYIATKVHSLTRFKSKFLEVNPHLDKREREAGKNTPSNNKDEDTCYEQGS